MNSIVVIVRAGVGRMRGGDPCGRPRTPGCGYKSSDRSGIPCLNNNIENENNTMQDTEIVLSDNEIHMLNALASRAGEQAQSVESLLEGVELSYAQGLSALGYLCAKGLAESVVIGSEQKRVLRKTGQDYLEQGLPEQRLWHHLIERGSLTLQEIKAYLPQSEAKFTIGMYLGAFQKAGYVAFAGGAVTPRQQDMP